MKRTTGVPQHNWRHSPARGMVIGDREVETSLLTQRAHSDGEAAVDPYLHLYDRGTEIFGALSLRLRPRHSRRVRRTGGAPGGIYARRGIGGKPKATPTRPPTTTRRLRRLLLGQSRAPSRRALQTPPQPPPPVRFSLTCRGALKRKNYYLKY